ncbi:copper-translocating P-type ATPase [Hydrogenovibrio marinus]|uniref:ATPase n=1 Tax=Hydrogenovibrio marinus TaxID=28885 RepID=A0A066ZYF6_HYDMR|nr:copper-translocating P-type ATPase [Hydrogenovibrio marinus]KDN95386.1 ATPase [Hydrogenovibrio marinus]BBN59874.1 heavy metal translocating P-type ATPase [Hydrogenovibrio marinus]
MDVKHTTHHSHAAMKEKDGMHQHHHHNHHQHMIEDFRQRFWVSMILTIPILFLSPMLQTLFGFEKSLSFNGDKYWLLVFSTIIFIYGGTPFLKGLWSELSNKTPGMMTLIAVAISTAFFYSAVVVLGLPGKVFFWELATLIDLMLLGHWIEMKSVVGASQALQKLAALMPTTAHKISEGNNLIEVNLEDLKPGDKVLVKPGEKIPSDGVVLEGESSVNQAMLTGESNPISKQTSDPVIGGTVNGEGSLTIKVEKTGKDSFLSQVILLVEKAQESKSKTQNLANRAAVWLTIVALSGGAITFFAWSVILSHDIAFSLERTVTVMVITCPHALGLAIPLVVAVSTALAARNGLMIRNRTAFEMARNLQAIVFDKTGTLTKGEFGITDVVCLEGSLNEKNLLMLASSIEQHSEHPIAKAIAKASTEFFKVDNFKSIPGKGAEGTIEQKHVQVVSPGYLSDNNITFQSKQIEQAFESGKTVIFVLTDGELKGAIALADMVREESIQSIKQLQAMGIQCMMLTGDNHQVAKAVSDEIGLDDYFAEVLPQEKAKKIQEIQARGLLVGMVGDGVNDAPALVQADVGIAIGAGTEVAIESADIILVHNDPRDVVATIELAKKTYRKMIQNLWWAAGYNIIAMPLAAGVLFNVGILLSPAAGAVLMSLSTVVVAINAKLLKYEK